MDRKTVWATAALAGALVNTATLALTWGTSLQGASATPAGIVVARSASVASTAVLASPTYHPASTTARSPKARAQ